MSFFMSGLYFRLRFRVSFMVIVSFLNLYSNLNNTNLLLNYFISFGKVKRFSTAPSWKCNI